MKHRQLILGSILLAACLAQPASAQTVKDQVVEQLRQSGFKHIRITQTILGRLRIVAQDGDTTREIVINPRTGEVLRDYSRARDEDDDAHSDRDDDYAVRSGNSRDDDDEDDDDDADDDDDDDDDDDADEDDDDEDDDDDDDDDEEDEEDDDDEKDEEDDD